jgi:chromosome partitioning protein
MSGPARKLPRIPGSPRVPERATATERSRTIAVYSVKGGVGKTTLASNLAWCSARHNAQRTLLWDLDAAGGATFLFGLEPRGSNKAEDLFARNRSAESLIQPSGFEGLDVLPADESIRTLDSQLARIGKRKRLARLAEGLASTYQRIILDCPPVMNEISAQVVRAADVVIVPLPPSPLSARALELVVREIAAHGKRHPPILPVFSMLDQRRSLHREARLGHPQWPVIPYSSLVEQCAVRQQPVGAFAPSSPAAKAFAALWAAIEGKLASLPL